MKKCFLAAALFLAFTSCYGQAGSFYFRSKIDSILKKPIFDSTQIAVSVYDFTEGLPVFNKSEKQLFRPASCLKILTTAAGLKFLGPDYNFKTSVYYTGTIKDSLLSGNVFIAGGFSPSLTTGDLQSIALQIKKAGIGRINGNIYADLSKADSLYWGKGWMWDDDSDISFPYMNALPVNKNTIKVITTPSAAAGPALVRIEPECNVVSIINKTATIEKDTNTVKAVRNWVNRTNEIEVTGLIGAKSISDTVEVNLIHPEKYFLSLFTEVLKRNNISFSGKADTLKTPAGASLIYELKQPLTESINKANKESSNLDAEMIMRASSYEKFKRKISPADGTKMIDSLITLTGLKKTSYRIADGSGNSFYNLVSAELIMETLKFIQQRPEMYRIILNSLPVAGVDGTMAGRLKDFSHLKNIYAKTGTLSGVSTLSGYLQTVHGHTMAFVILIQNFTGSPKRIRDIQDEICRAIFLIKSDKDE